MHPRKSIALLQSVHLIANASRATFNNDLSRSSARTITASATRLSNTGAIRLTSCHTGCNSATRHSSDNVQRISSRSLALFGRRLSSGALTRKDPPRPHHIDSAPSWTSRRISAERTMAEEAEVQEGQGGKRRSGRSAVKAIQSQSGPKGKRKAASEADAKVKANQLAASDSASGQDRRRKSKKVDESEKGEAEEDSELSSAEEVAPVRKKAKVSQSKGKENGAVDGKVSQKARGKVAYAWHPSAPQGGTALDTLADESLPKNMSLPDDLKLDRARKELPEEQKRIVVWNITSLNSAEKKGMTRYLNEEDADLVFLSETKCNEIPTFNSFKTLYPHQTWSVSSTKGYAGVALLSKMKPLSTSTTLKLPLIDSSEARAVHEHFGSGLLQEVPDDEKIEEEDVFAFAKNAKEAQAFEKDVAKGRIVTAEFENWIVVGTYAVNAGEGLKSLTTKRKWSAALSSHLQACQARKRTIWCGDLNVVMDARDLSAASKKWNKSPGYTVWECEAHRRLLGRSVTSTNIEASKNGDAEKENAGEEKKKVAWTDVWRDLHPNDVGHYTFYGFRGACRVKGIGWRLDSFILSPGAKDKVKACEIRHEIYGASDHLPIFLDVEW
ncbi:DNase I-like protein [Ceraceosorus guamensis]|uniref:DNase I-like protein n=1 Tax=Ceraceosorus guamensis TaxID=1522189 RepID=A0A316W1U7_9BASI|nr:DNase I-like protein [Ceraceosorus guamensis]PWN43867.1 DNase I-like protein [Ceraceosorus guamensis]